MKKLLIAFVAIAFCACGCHTAKNTASENKSEKKSEKTSEVASLPLTATKWGLTHINGEPVKDSPETPFIIFMGDRVTGCLGCNTFFGTFYATKKGHLDLDYTGATKRLCNDMDVEYKFMTSLKAEKKSYHIKGDVLTIYGEKLSPEGVVKQTELLRFQAEK